MGDPLTIHIPGEIRGKGRPRFARTSKGVRTFSDSKTEAAENWVRSCAIDQVGQPVLEGPLALDVAITVAIPESWSKRKKADAAAGVLRPTGKPDLDNTVKLLADALNKIVWRDDSQITMMRLSKHYGNAAGALVTVRVA